MALELNRENINAARQILDHPIVAEILTSMESDALNSAVNAKLTDTDTPTAYLAEVRAIRSFRSRLNFLIQEGSAQLARKTDVK